MDDLGNIIYVIVILVSLVASFWQKANKAKEERRQAAPEEELQPIPRPARTVAQRDFIPQDASSLDEQKNASLALLREMEVKAKLAASGRGKRRSEIMDAQVVREEKMQQSQPSELLQDFDLKKAIIYNEILNRPYQ